jgi:hypothetical protein
MNTSKNIRVIRPVRVIRDQGAPMCEQSPIGNQKSEIQSLFALRAGVVTNATDAAAGREYACRFVRAGQVRAAGNRPSNVTLPEGPLKMAVEKGLFEARASFIDHAGWFDYPSLRNLAGVVISAFWNEQDRSVDGVIRLNGTPAADALAPILDDLVESIVFGEPAPDVGLSLVFWPRWQPRDNYDDPLVLAEIRYVESIDFVFEPAADGRVKSALSRALSALTPSPFQGEGGVRVNPTQETGGFQMTESNTNPTPAPAPVVAQDHTAEWLLALGDNVSQVMIANSGLPEVARERLLGRSYASPAEVETAIEAERAYLARLQEDQVITIGGTAPRSPQVQMGLNGMDQVRLAIEALLSSTKPQQGVRPLSGIRELYNLLSGDYEMRGVFNPERVAFANVNSSTMAGLVANALNKTVVNMFQTYPQWWGPAVTIEDFSTLQQIKWITLGGVGELPTVAAGAAYTELTWDDQTETATFVKKGGYLGIDIETIDKDDTRRLQAAPRALAQAAWLTLGKAIAAIFTDASGTGPTMSDSHVLFDATYHSNLGTSALSPTSWRATKIAMAKQTELNSGEVLSILTKPALIWVPVDLADYAAEILGSEGKPFTADNTVNVDAEGDTRAARLAMARRRIIECPIWTDTNNWAAQADPNLYPSIGLGFRFGREPEIFSVASPTAGLMFTNDTLPIKARFFFAVGPTDWRGLYKHNVS